MYVCVYVCMCVYVCIHVYIYIYTYAYIYIYMYVCVCICICIYSMHTHMHTNIHKCLSHACRYVRACRCTRAYAEALVYVHVTCAQHAGARVFIIVCEASADAQNTVVRGVNDTILNYRPRMCIKVSCLHISSCLAVVSVAATTCKGSRAPPPKAMMNS